MSKTHGLTKTRTYRIWCGVRSRCCNPCARDFAAYGARGILLCPRWHIFENFLSDMGVAPDGLSIDRIDGMRGYEPGNCRWATRVEQNRNQADLRFLEMDGRIQCLSAWAEEFRKPESSIRARLGRGWEIGRALRTPIRAHKPYERRAS